MAHVLADADLVIRAKAADQHALTTLYLRYAPAIYKYIWYRVRDAEVAEDLCADVFVRMLEGIERYEDRGWPLSAWLYRIAHDRTVDAMRRRGTRSHLPLEALNGTSDSPEDAVAGKLDWEAVRYTLQSLTANQRKVIQMRFLEDMSVQEVANAMGRTESAVKALQHRGLQSMARHLSDQI